MEARFNSKVLLVTSDVKQMLMVKEEAPDDHRPNADLYDPEPQHIKEEQEEVCISLGGEQFNVKVGNNAIRFPVSATPIKSEDDKQSPLLLQLYQDQIEGRELPQLNNVGKSVRIQDHGDASISLQAEDTEKDEEDDDVKHPVSELKHLSDSGPRTMDKDDWKESRAPKADGNMNKPFSSSEITEQLVYHHSLQKHMTDSETGTSSSLENMTCFIEGENVNSQRKVQTGGTFSSEDCEKTFITKQTFNRHTEIHTGDKPFCCDLCRQRFSRKSTLNSHMRIHTGLKPFCCDLCGQRFSRKSTLNRHMRIHSGHKPFCCDLCGQRFGEKSTLNKHMQIHTGQKPFRCDSCGQRFSQKGNLNSHLGTHTGEKPFCCDLCRQRFSRKSTLNSHMRIHTGLKPFCCDLCGQRFRHKSALNRHMRIHSGHKPFC